MGKRKPRIIGKMEVALVQAKSDKWYFAGFGVPASLAVCNKDGSPATPEKIEIAKECGPRLAGLRIRTWDCEHEAIADAMALGMPRYLIQVSPNRL